MERKPIPHDLTARRAGQIIASVTFVVALAGGVLMWLIDNEDFPTIGSGMWWSVQTITTVGYGDATPTDPVGRLVGAGIMLIAIASLSILTAFITSAFVEARQADRRAETEARDAAHREVLEARLADLVARLERIERQGQARS